MKLNSNIRQWYNELTPVKKRMVVVGLLLCVLSLLLVLQYSRRSSSITPVAESPTQTERPVSMDVKLLERTELAEAQRANQELRRELENLKTQMQQIEQQQKKQQSMPPVPPPPPPPSENEEVTPAPLYPPPPAPSGATEQQQQNKSMLLGGIKIVTGQPGQDAMPTPPTTDEKKNEQRKVYLPPSFMEGTLLSGLNAPTVESAKKDPMPALIRVSDIAVLPNDVKADLRGCFIIAHGYGSLSSERAYLKLVSLSCLSKRGTAVIDQPINGFVVDTDGQIGLAGNVVAKLGSTIARAALAGFFQGVGDYMKQASVTTQITGAGSFQTIDADKALAAGLGSGISTAFGELAKFYMELARQTMPVIEVGATKEITVVVSEGVELVIHDKQGVNTAVHKEGL